MRQYYVYIITNNKNKPLYIGFTGNLLKRIFQHKNNLNEGFSKKYKLYKLVYFEIHYNPITAIEHEKRYKNWHREWKLNLIRSINPSFRDLSIDLWNLDAEINSA